MFIGHESGVESWRYQTVWRINRKVWQSEKRALWIAWHSGMIEDHWLKTLEIEMYQHDLSWWPPFLPPTPSPHTQWYYSMLSRGICDVSGGCHRNCRLIESLKLAPLQAELLENKSKPQEEKSDDHELSYEPKHQSIAQVIYAENRVSSCVVGCGSWRACMPDQIIVKDIQKLKDSNK